MTRLPFHSKTLPYWVLPCLAVVIANIGALYIYLTDGFLPFPSFVVISTFVIAIAASRLLFRGRSWAVVIMLVVTTSVVAVVGQFLSIRIGLNQIFLRSLKDFPKKEFALAKSMAQVDEDERESIQNQIFNLYQEYDLLFYHSDISLMHGVWDRVSRGELDQEGLDQARLAWNMSHYRNSEIVIHLLNPIISLHRPTLSPFALYFGVILSIAVLGGRHRKKNGALILPTSEDW